MRQQMLEKLKGKNHENSPHSFKVKKLILKIVFYICFYLLKQAARTVGPLKQSK